MKTLPLGPLYFEFSRHNEPRIRINPGETVLVETEDAFCGQVRTDADRRDSSTMTGSNPQTGPIWVEGAQPGDTLAVTIDSIEPSIGQCATRTGNVGRLHEWLGSNCPHGTHVCPIRDGVIHWFDKITIPFTPMLGCIGTAPASGVPTTGPAGPHGGNMDIRETAPGATVYLPVFIEGAYLYLGDVHAAQGHGELCGSGLEMPSNTTITVNLVSDKIIPAPRIESSTEIIAIATGCPTERSVAQAYARLILWMEEEYDWHRWKAYDLLTHVGEISLGYFAGGTAGAKIAKQYLKGSR
jgi:amidase